MGKNDVSKGTSTDDNSSTESAVTVSKAEARGDVELVFKQNRSFELHIGRSTFCYGPMGRQRVPSWVVEHKDFQTQAHYFIVNK